MKDAIEIVTLIWLISVFITLIIIFSGYVRIRLQYKISVRIIELNHSWIVRHMDEIIHDKGFVNDVWWFYNKTNDSDIYDTVKFPILRSYYSKEEINKIKS